jgi:hypothetical protein
MFKKVSALPLFAFVLASACGDGKDDGSAVPPLLPRNAASTSGGATSDSPASGSSSGTTSGSAGSEAPSSATRASAIDRELTDLVIQSAPWGDLEVSVTGARLFRGERPDTLPKSVKFSADQVYAVLDVKIEAGDQETDYRDRDTWDLILGNGKRVTPVNPLDVLLLPGDAPTVSIYYEVEEDADFSGAALELNGTDRETFEPLRIPLGSAEEFESEVELPALVGETFQPFEDGELTFEVLDAVYGVNIAESGRRAPRDQRLVALTVRVGYEGDFSYSFSTDDDGPRISFNGSSHEADNGRIETIGSGDTEDFVLIYGVDEDATEFDVVFDTGDPEVERVAVEVPSLLPSEADESEADESSDESSDESEDAASVTDDEPEEWY